MIKVIIFLVIALSLIIYGYSLPARGFLPVWLNNYELLIYCTLTGGLGGVLYCLRAVYLNRCIRGEWDKNWETWYFLRPLVSLISGTVSYIFLKAGLLILEAQEIDSSTNFGFIALAFIAGLNVDNFIKKIESIAQSAWGIEKSRSAKDNKGNNK